MKKVSFDFDDTLSFKSTQDYAKTLIDKGIEVHITTSRYESINDYPKDFLKAWEKLYGKKATNIDLYLVAKELNISEEYIHFTNMQDKYLFFKDKDFIWHLDDSYVECLLINKNTETKGIDSLSGNYQELCNQLLNIENETD